MFVMRYVGIFLVMALTVSCQSSQINKQHADRNQFYQDVKTAKVIVQESYGAHKGISLPFKNYVETWLRMANVVIVDDAAGSADCIIRIVADGKPLKATYGSRGLFTGARLSGTIQIERPSLHKDEVPFSSVINPPRSFPGGDTVDYERPEHAPFLRALPGGNTGTDKTAFDGFTFRLAALMGQYFGRSVLLIALDDYASKGLLRESAIEALAAQGLAAAPYLIDAFLYCSPEAEKGLGETLEKITGEKYGTDVKRWTEWLGQHQQELQTVPGKDKKSDKNNDYRADRMIG